MCKFEIYYFSGTGNSLHVAKELSGRIPGAKLTPIVSLLNKDIIETDAEAVGFVFPTHGMTAPIPVVNFLRKLSPTSAKYFFAVATRCGTKCFAFNKINKILKHKGKDLNAYFVLNMANNDPKFEVYEVPSVEKIAVIELQVQEQLDLIAKTISNKETRQENDPELYKSSFLLDLLVGLGMKYARHDGAKDYFYSDEKCTGCGICEKVCPSKKCSIVEGKPMWQKDVKCYLCYACLNYCPMQAVQIKTTWYMKSFTDKNGRYLHPYATANDIAAQK